MQASNAGASCQGDDSRATGHGLGGLGSKLLNRAVDQLCVALYAVLPHLPAAGSAADDHCSGHVRCWHLFASTKRRLQPTFPSVLCACIPLTAMAPLTDSQIADAKEAFAL